MSKKEKLEALAKNTSDLWVMKQHEILPGDKYVVGLYRVMFGFRLRVFKIGASVFDSPILDWCLGANQTSEVVYKRFLVNLFKAGGNDVINELPRTSKLRPVYKDKSFHTHINEIAEKYESAKISDALRKTVNLMQVKVS